MPGSRRGLVSATCVALALAAVPVRAEVTVRDPGQFVVDQANIIDASTQQRLEGWLLELEQKTAAQVKVLTVPTTDGEEIFAFAQRHFDLWKLGQQGKDNGALIVLALKERQVRIHTGYGLEGALPDSWSGSLSREVAGQFFKRGDYAQGLYRMAVTVVNKVADEYGVTVAGVPAVRHQVRQRGGKISGFVCLLIALVVIIAMFAGGGRRGRHRRAWGGGLGDALFWGAILSQMSRGGGSSWGGGSHGGFGGGFGGFGGSFGGGGSSGGGGGGASW
jgi:uncharacterized protein